MKPLCHTGVKETSTQHCTPSHWLHRVDETIFKRNTSKSRLLYQSSEKCWQEKKRRKKTLSMEAFLHTVFARTTRRAVSSTRMEHNCMHVFVIVKGRCGTGSHFRKLTCLGDIRITTPEQMPAYSYLLPACHSPGHLTSPWRCSSPRPCHTCAGTPETLQTHTHTHTWQHS